MPEQTMTKEHAAAKVEADLRTLRQDFTALRSDVKTDLNDIRSDLTALARDYAGAATSTLTDRSQHAVEAVEHRIEERPIASTLLAFGLGVGAGMILGLGRAGRH